MSSNEELALAIKAGDRSKEGELWEQIVDFIRQQAGRYYQNGQQDRAVVDIDDFVQAGYFAMLNAVQDFDPDSGYKFLTYLSKHLQNENNITGGNRTQAQKKDPSEGARSLDAPIPGASEDGDISLYDTIADPAEPIEDAEERLYYEELHRDIDKALDRIPETCADVIRREYWQGQSIQQIADAHGCSHQNIRAHKAKAMRELRKRSNDLRKYAEELNYFRHVGIGRFQNTGMSATEALALRKIEHELEQARRILAESNLQ